MADKTDLAMAQIHQEVRPDMLQIGDQDRELLRRLAGRVAELAARPIEEEKRELWYRHNALEPTRPLVSCHPENAWNEIITPDCLKCQGELARRWEKTLRKEVFWGEEICDDRVIEPYFNVPHVYEGSDWGLDAIKIGGEEGGAYTWDPPIKSYDFLDQMHVPVITVDYETTAQLVELAEEMLGDLLTVRLKTRWYWTQGLTLALAYLRGLEQVMYDLLDYPDDLHRLMAFLRDGYMARLDFLEENRLLSLDNDDTYCGSGGFGWTHELPQPDFDGHVRTRDLWGFAESQETVGISPEMFAEFVFPYQLPLLERFGLIYYGCCEPLDKRWHIIQAIPSLRRVSVSPWADRAKMAEMLGDRYVYVMKPNPADLAMESFDEERIRAEIREDLRITRECRVEVIMKDTHTIRNDPQRLIRWTQIVREEAEAL